MSSMQTAKLLGQSQELWQALGPGLSTKVVGTILGNTPIHPDIEAGLRFIPSETSDAERRLLYRFFSECWTGKNDVIEIGPFLGGTTRAIALGMMTNSLYAPGSSILHTYDKFRYAEGSRLVSLLERHFAEGILTETIKRDLLSEKIPNFYTLFLELHRNSPYFPILSIGEMALPNSPKEEIELGKRFSLDSSKRVDAVFIDGCKSWYGTKYFLQEVSKCTGLGSYFIFQDYGWYTCFWLPTILSLLGGVFSLQAYIDSTYVFQQKGPLTPDEVEKRVPDSWRALSAKDYERIFYMELRNAAERCDLRALVFSKIQFAGALASVDEKDRAKSLIESLLSEAISIPYQKEITAALVQPTYTADGPVFLN